jgi:hypothetical protein
MSPSDRHRIEVLPWIVAGIAGIAAAAYLMLFLVQPVGGEGSRLTRLHLLLVLLTPEDVLRSATQGGSPAQGLLDRGIALSATAAGLWCALWIGWWPLRWIGGTDNRPRWEQGVFATGLGLHLISLVTLAVGLLGWLQSPVLAMVLGAGGVLLPLRAWLGGRSTKPLAQQPAAIYDSEHRLWLIGVAVAALFAVIIVLGAALPPWDFDVREYHLQVPKEWYQAGRIEFLPYNMYANMPLGAEMIPLAAMSVLSDWWLGAIVGKTLMGACAVVTAVAIYGLSRRLAGPLAAVAAALLWLSHPWAIHVAISGLNEQVYALYLTLAVSAIAGRDVSLRSWLLAGVFAGAAAACKYPAVVMLVMPLAGWAVLAPRITDWYKTPWRLRLAALGCFALAAAFSGGAWYAKNAVQAGNPVYPLLGHVLGGKTRTPAKNEQFAKGHAVPPYTAAKLAESARRIGWRSEHQSPLLIPLVLLGMCAAARPLVSSKMTNARISLTNPQSLVIGIWSLVISFLAIWWLFTHRLDRFLVPAIPLAASAAAVGIEFALSRPLKWVLWPLMGIGLLYNLAYVAYPMPISILALTGDNRWLAPLEVLRVDPPPVGEEEPIRRLHSDIRWLNENVRPGKSVLCIGEAAVFDLQVPVYYHTCFDDCLLVEWMADKTAGERKRILHERQVGLVYVDWSAIERYRAPGNYGFDPRFSRELLDELVAQQVLSPPLDDAPPETYRVLP